MEIRFQNGSFYNTLVILLAFFIVGWGCLLILKPFLPAVLWGIILCLTTWPAYTWLLNRLNRWHVLSASVMTLFLTLCFLLPLLFLGGSMADNFGELSKGLIETLQSKPETAPQWTQDLPLIGPYVQEFWTHYISDVNNMALALQGYAQPATEFLIGLGKAVGIGIFDLTLGLLIAFFFFLHGDVLAARVDILIHRFIGERGQHLLDVSKKTMIGVVYGIVGAALAQGTVAGIGFWIAGIPSAPFLGILTMVFSFLPFGTIIIWVPVAIWLFTQDMVGMAIFMTVWGSMVSSLDNFIRPYFISIGSALPLALVLLGVFGGIINFGFIGLFIGPTLLAIGYSLVVEWSEIEAKKPIGQIPPGEKPLSQKP